MAGKTYAQLGTSADVQDADLVATFRSTGPLKTVTGTILKGYCQTFTSALLVQASAAAPVSPVDYIKLKPSDYAAGKPGLFVTKSSTAGIWTASVTDGSTLGELDFSVSTLKVSGALTVTGLTTTAASATGSAGFNLPAGAAPTSPVHGDLWTTSTAAFIRLNGTTLNVGVGVAEVRNQQATGVANTEAGWSGGVWNARVLNTLGVNTLGATLASNKITLPPGTYTFVATGEPLGTANGSPLIGKWRLYDNTGSTVLGGQPVSIASIAGAQQLIPFGFSGAFTISVASAIGCDFQPTAGGGVFFYGGPGGAGTTEVYTSIIFTKVA